MKELSNVKVGENVKVLKVCGQGPIKRRIMDMGITRGTNIFVRKTAPLGDPIEISIRGYELTIRKEDAKIILVEESE